MSLHRVMIVSYHFPPDREIGALRPSALSNNFPAFQWLPVVLTVKEQYYEGTNLKDAPDNLDKIILYRTFKLPGINTVIKTLQALIFKKKPPFSQAPKDSNETPEIDSTKNHKESFSRKLLRYYNSFFVCLPDMDHGWIALGVMRGLIAIKKHNVDAILTTSPPHSAQLIGLLLHILSGKPLIADFRDPWALDLLPERYQSNLSLKISHWLEKLVVGKAYRVISVTEEMTRRLIYLYPEFSDKFLTVPNGFDAQEISRYSEISKYDKFTITYTGSLYFGRDPFVFLLAVSELIRKGDIERTSLQIRFVGNCRFCDGKSVETEVALMGLDDIVMFIDPIPRSDALLEIAKSHVALVLAPQQPLQIPGKLYDYLGMHSVILCVCENGATQRLLTQYPLACIVEPNDLEAMKSTILGLFQNRNGKTSTFHLNFPFEIYERKSIAKQVTVLLNESIGSKDVEHETA